MTKKNEGITLPKAFKDSILDRQLKKVKINPLLEPRVRTTEFCVFGPFTLCKVELRIGDRPVTGYGRAECNHLDTFNPDVGARTSFSRAVRAAAHKAENISRRVPTVD